MGDDSCTDYGSHFTVSWYNAEAVRDSTKEPWCLRCKAATRVRLVTSSALHSCSRRLASSIARICQLLFPRRASSGGLWTRRCKQCSLGSSSRLRTRLGPGVCRLADLSIAVRCHRPAPPDSQLLCAPRIAGRAGRTHAPSTAAMSCLRCPKAVCACGCSPGQRSRAFALVHTGSLCC